VIADDRCGPISPRHGRRGTALARLARAFRPLSPLGRGIAAVAVAGLGLGALVAALVRARR